MKRLISLTCIVLGAFAEPKRGGGGKRKEGGKRPDRGDSSKWESFVFQSLHEAHGFTASTIAAHCDSVDEWADMEGKEETAIACRCRNLHEKSHSDEELTDDESTMFYDCKAKVKEFKKENKEKWEAKKDKIKEKVKDKVKEKVREKIVSHRRCRALGKANKQSADQMSDNDKAAWTKCKAKFQERIEKFKACKAEEDEAKREEMGCPKGKRPKNKREKRKKGKKRG